MVVRNSQLINPTLPLLVYTLAMVGKQLKKMTLWSIWKNR